MLLWSFTYAIYAVEVEDIFDAIFNAAAINLALFGTHIFGIIFITSLTRNEEEDITLSTIGDIFWIHCQKFIQYQFNSDTVYCKNRK